ncbi:MAG: hypothetical protein HY319_04495 [Armatimonadetes bacterium]|nr:hypothetical protein [Armatimonadota bacterium]
MNRQEGNRHQLLPWVAALLLALLPCPPVRAGDLDDLDLRVRVGDLVGAHRRITELLIEGGDPLLLGTYQAAGFLQMGALSGAGNQAENLLLGAQGATRLPLLLVVVHSSIAGGDWARARDHLDRAAELVGPAGAARFTVETLKFRLQDELEPGLPEPGKFLQEKTRIVELWAAPGGDEFPYLVQWAARAFSYWPRRELAYLRQERLPAELRREMGRQLQADLPFLRDAAAQSGEAALYFPAQDLMLDIAESLRRNGKGAETLTILTAVPPALDQLAAHLDSLEQRLGVRDLKEGHLARLQSRYHHEFAVLALEAARDRGLRAEQAAELELHLQQAASGYIRSSDLEGRLRLALDLVRGERLGLGLVPDPQKMALEVETNANALGLTAVVVEALSARAELALDAGDAGLAADLLEQAWRAAEVYPDRAERFPHLSELRREP